ncbi:GNAT family N-acetyltransferase [bacterium (Candidatus Blackallbacteria) CG17_big_fil_post_rev_8_21_14_2_50_48_46]|uniref:GNAT family N-acetyltransferase n=1 Tax=bacterium (Candidatus Blackallbacteria) CG17_big_fil_post_rev_8_21_14_2_50_48_46 TaxID=2014261 RepID=A0A2M7FZF7_9BACT|nr:MAG: GNAT family N-acetyltransferase [bacterium (Candidatus Blackallbacteria) CG18_big_fil_WC_8_21_14_2_50_49_26]PIW14760.1 MAG: GNAT family N-acetyltransferase [bacterium (Candidatus Blackallbacteria) CG17_big_fil_post_rev_8_21_14_2_50_48_46]PIW50862.1 MAG: GNAT family N-acetyltransferase [bacterium (Candidatus Blackallbacteria) CG13_big_fil_rev_8_21_14_2_50_49_14]
MFESALNVKLRPAQVQDAAQIAAVHVASWETTYRGILPDALLQMQSLEKRTQNWQDWLESQAMAWVWVAEKAGKIWGFVSGGPERSQEPEAQGEIYALYLLAEAQGLGIGKALLYKGFEELHKAGYQGILVWVARENLHASRFYALQGGQALRERELQIAGFQIAETGYLWLG